MHLLQDLLVLGLHIRLRAGALLQLIHDLGPEGLDMRAHDLADLLSVLEDHKGRHGADAEFLGDVGDFVDVELVEAGVRVGVGELDDFGGDGFAGGAPGGHAVDDHEGRVGEGFVVGGFAGEGISLMILGGGGGGGA